MPPQTRTAAPRLHPIELPGLRDGGADDLGPDELVEGVRFSRLDLTGRDLEGIVLDECELADVVVGETELRGARVLRTRFERLQATVLKGSRATFTDVAIAGSRLGAAELYEAGLERVVISASKLGWVNLRSASLRDVELRGCSIDELDLTGARVLRLRLVDCTIGMLQLAHADLNHVDLRGAQLQRIGGVGSLRGATVSTEQVIGLLDIITGHLGIRVED